MAFNRSDQAPPLEGVRVLDLTRILAGPFATMILGDLGAEVIKIERPGHGDETRHWGPPFDGDVATYHQAVNRNKRSVTLDLKSDAGREVAWRLIDWSDVMVSNFRPGVMDRLGLGYEQVAARRPELIYCVINGYGESGAGALRSSFDLIIQAQTGLMELTGVPDGPPTKVGISIADEVAGLYMVQGVQSALLARSRSGSGQLVEVALHDAMLSMFTYQVQGYLSSGQEPRRMGNAHPSLVPYRPFDASDGVVIVGVASDSLWRRFCDAVGLQRLAADERFVHNVGRVEHREELERAIAEHLVGASKAHWVEALERAGVPCGTVRTVVEALESSDVQGRDMVVRCPDSGMRMLGLPVRLSRNPGRIRSAPPRLGQHTDEVLREIGYDAAAIRGLRQAGVI